jgi:hypothetical protein
VDKLITVSTTVLRVHPLGKGKARSSDIVCLGCFRFCCFLGFGFEGLSGFGLEGFGIEELGFLLVWRLSCILSVYLGVPYAF